MLQRFPFVLKQVKAGSTSEHLLNEVLTNLLIYSLCGAKEFTIKVCNNITNSITV